VRELLRGVAELAPAPRPQPAEPRPISPDEPRVAGFVFKVRANIDPQHRDRIAFVRISSGRFQRGMKLKNIRTGRLMSVQAPVFFLARERNLAEEAWPGDMRLRCSRSAAISGVCINPSDGGPKVRIRLPPPASHVRT
jgi:peptide chain release factor 3